MTHHEEVFCPPALSLMYSMYVFSQFDGTQFAKLNGYRMHFLFSLLFCGNQEVGVVY